MLAKGTHEKGGLTSLTQTGGFETSSQDSYFRRFQYYHKRVCWNVTPERHICTFDLVFSNVDRQDVVSHKNDPVVLLMIMMGKNVHHVLIDQGSSTNVMFRDIFVGLQIPRDQLQPFNRVLVGFFGGARGGKGVCGFKDNFFK